METEPVVKLQVLVNEELLDVADAAERYPHQVSEKIASAQAIITKTTLKNTFLTSIQSKRPKKPYRLDGVAASCIRDWLPDDALETRFFRHKGFEGITALAVTLADDKSIGALLHSLPQDGLISFIESINTINAHGDFKFMCSSIERSSRKATSRIEEVYLAGSRPPQPKKDTKDHTRKRRRTSENSSIPGRETTVGRNNSHRLSLTDGAHDPAPLPCEAGDGFSTDLENVWDRDGNFGIDLDTLGLDLRTPRDSPHFGIDLDDLKLS